MTETPEDVSVTSEDTLRGDGRTVYRASARRTLTVEWRSSDPVRYIAKIVFAFFVQVVSVSLLNMFFWRNSWFPVVRFLIYLSMSFPVFYDGVAGIVNRKILIVEDRRLITHQNPLWRAGGVCVACWSRPCARGCGHAPRA